MAKWELIKYEIRKVSIAYSKKEKQPVNKVQNTLEKELIELERNLTNDNKERYNTVKQELQDIENVKIQGAIERSKVKDLEEGERKHTVLSRPRKIKSDK